MTIKDEVLAGYKKLSGKKDAKLPIVLTLEDNKMDLTLPVPAGVESGPMRDLFDYGLKALSSDGRQPRRTEDNGFLSLSATIEDGDAARAIEALKTPPQNLSRLGVYLIVDYGGISSSVAKELTGLPNNRLSAALSGMKKRGVLAKKSRGVFERVDNFNYDKGKMSLLQADKQDNKLPATSAEAAPTTTLIATHDAKISRAEIIMQYVAEHDSISYDKAHALFPDVKRYHISTLLGTMRRKHILENMEDGRLAKGQIFDTFRPRRHRTYNITADALPASTSASEGPEQSDEAGISLPRETVNYKLMRLAVEGKGSLDSKTAVRKLAAKHTERSVRFALYALKRDGFFTREKRGAPYTVSKKAMESAHYVDLFAGSARIASATGDNLSDTPLQAPAQMLSDTLPTSPDELIAYIGKLYDSDPRRGLLETALRTIERPGIKNTASQMAKRTGQQERTEDIRKLMKDLYYAGLVDMEKGSYSLNRSGRPKKHERPAEVLMPETVSSNATAHEPEPVNAIPITTSLPEKPKENPLVAEVLERYADDARRNTIGKVLRRIAVEGAPIGLRKIAFNTGTEIGLAARITRELYETGYLERLGESRYKLRTEAQIRPMAANSSVKGFGVKIEVKTEKPVVQELLPVKQPVAVEKDYAPDDTDKKLLEIYAGEDGIGRRVLAAHASELGISPQDILTRTDKLKAKRYLKASPDGSLKLADAGAYETPQRPESYLDAIKGVFIRKERGEALGRSEVIRMAGLKDGEFEKAESYGMFVRRGHNYTLTSRDWDAVKPKE